jgi:hypothetical protein
MKTKKCNKCNEIKVVTDFHKNKKTNDGYRNECKTCRIIETKLNYEKNKTFEIVGLTPVELKVYLENKFEYGMTWENYGVWHIDHLIPLSSVNEESKIYDLCYYTNLQPMWGNENLSKGKKIL